MTDFATRAVHAGERARRGDYTPVVSPIHPSVGFLYDSMQDLEAVFETTKEGYVYPRYGSPTVAAFEDAVAELEGGGSAHAYASGMAAIHAALLAAGVKAGVGVVAGQDVYGATYTLLSQLMSQLGARIRFVDMTDPVEVRRALRQMKPAAFLVETVSNPLLKVADLRALAEIAHEVGAQFLVDNTFASPYLCRPLALGADFVIHSATKYLGGHGDVMAGVVITSPEKRKTLYELNKMVGGVLGPFEAWLSMRGLKTLPLRMRQQCENGMRIAIHLETHPKIERVNYPGLEGHPQHALAERLFERRGYGGMLSFEIAGADQETVFSFMERLELCLPATTLGDIYTLLLHPASSSHRGLTPEERARVGIRPGLVRLSAGIESAKDIIADLDHALESIKTAY
jgi:cystathionine beta-lyase/cystathionine gamma-synthase